MSAARPSPVMRPLLRPEIQALFQAEEKSLQARRLLIAGSQPASAVEAFAASELIEEAIGQLVAARAFINATPSTATGDTP